MLVDRKRLTAAVAMFVKMNKMLFKTNSAQSMIEVCIYKGTLKLAMNDLDNQIDVTFPTDTAEVFPSFYLEPIELKRALSIVKGSDVDIRPDGNNHWCIANAAVMPRLYADPRPADPKELPARFKFPDGARVVGKWTAPVELRKIIDTCIVHASSDETRYILNGIHMDKTHGAFVATDGHRLTASMRSTGAEFRDFQNDTFNTRCAVHLASALNAFGGSCEARAFGEKGVGRFLQFVILNDDGVEFRLTTRPIDGDYPLWTTVIPGIAGKKNDPKARVYAMQTNTIGPKLHAAAKAIGVSRGAPFYVRLSDSNDNDWLSAVAFDPGRLEMSKDAKNSLSSVSKRDKGYRPIEFTFGNRVDSNKKIEVWPAIYNIRYLCDAIGKNPGVVTMTILDGETCVKIEHEDGRLCVVMPARIGF